MNTTIGKKDTRPVAVAPIQSRIMQTPAVQLAVVSEMQTASVAVKPTVAEIPLRAVLADFVKTKACVHAADDDVYIRFLVCPMYGVPTV